MSFLGFTSTRLGSEVSCPMTLPEKTQRNQCSLNPRSLDYESNTLPLSHVGPSKIERIDCMVFNATSTIFQLYHSGQYTFPGVLLHINAGLDNNGIGIFSLTSLGLPFIEVMAGFEYTIGEINITPTVAYALFHHQMSFS